MNNMLRAASKPNSFYKKAGWLDRINPFSKNTPTPAVQQQAVSVGNPDGIVSLNDSELERIIAEHPGDSNFANWCRRNSEKCIEREEKQKTWKEDDSKLNEAKELAQHLGLEIVKEKSDKYEYYLLKNPKTNRNISNQTSDIDDIIIILDNYMENKHYGHQTRLV